MRQSNGADLAVHELVVVRVDDEINQALAGHRGQSYESPPQPRGQALTLVQVLLGYASFDADGDTRWSCPIAGGRRTVAVKPASEIQQQGGLP
jgi:hypothetical protein